MTRVRLRVRALWAALTAVLIVMAGGAVVLPAAPAQAAVSITCEPDVVYSVSGKGQLRKAAGGVSTDIGSPASGVGNFNGLGIGKKDSAVYAFNRSSSGSGGETVEIYRFDTSTGRWYSTQKKKSSDVAFIGGAVDLKSGLFYFGGYTADGKKFRLFVYDPNSGELTSKGWINTSTSASGSSNGDIAFDSSGNLFVVRGVGKKTTIFSVTSTSLVAGSGENNEIVAGDSKERSTTDKVNGVAFDANGTGYLGAESTVSGWDTPDWSNAQEFFAGTHREGLFGWREVWDWIGDTGSTDLASCSSPATITLQKDIKNGRAKASDQFRLNLEQNGSSLATGTTAGSTTGLQKVGTVGPLPAKRGVTIDFSETAGTSDTDLDDYYSEYSCTVEGSQKVLASGEATSGSVKIPVAGQGDAVICTITNSPLTANVSIHKDVVDENGENKKPGKDWSVGAKATATSDTVSSTPTAATQKTDANGDAKWGLRFSKTTGRATIAVSETQQDGYEFKSGSCDITRLDGSKATTRKLTSDKSFDLTGIKPGDDVKCSYLNKVKDTSLTLVKKVDNTAAAGTAKDTDWTLKAEGDAASGDKTIEGKTGSEPVTKAKVKAGKYALSETGTPKGYEASDWACAPTSGSGVVTSDKSSVTLKNGDDVACTITNTAKTGAVTWGKTDEAGNALEGSVWTLTDPDGKSTEIEDCTAASADKCAGPDKDPAAGKFSVDRLKWGKHTLVEKKAPAGYILDDTPHTFTVSGSALDKSLGSFTNEQKPPMALPLTGGTGSQIYLIGGAALLAAAGAIALLKGLRRRNRKH
ncbi:SpaA isopeptide-forming pilin-related protein [Brevibacterium limosum]|uniref:SpaA isopeptide-forming pilin-related protein n=1 Tax=Brevibacterium limosum TaxID=2697565 RepID=UPI0014213A30|nr:SpaA isopeptide-forming pilin-related protein [Brevibacterium limosum]